MVRLQGIEDQEAGLTVLCHSTMGIVAVFRRACAERTKVIINCCDMESRNNIMSSELTLMEMS